MSALDGRRVLVTRPRNRAAVLVSLLESRGAVPVLLPAIATIPPDDPAPLVAAMARIEAYDWVVFTSASAVEAVFDALEQLDATVPAGVRIAAVGPATAEALRERGSAVHAMPAMFRGEEVAAAMGECAGARVFVPRSDIARPETVAMLRARGAEVDDVVAYRTVPADAHGEPVEGVLAGVDAITFTSPSGARGLAQLAPTSLARATAHATIACIGPVTSAAARELGLEVHVEPAAHTTQGLVSALEAYWAASPVRGGAS